jgi:D-alanyl-D-alanine carboxypeptidase
MNRYRRLLGLCLVAVLTGCGSSDAAKPTTAKTPKEPTSRATARNITAFPTAAFADIRDEPVTEEAAAEFRAILSEATDRGGMTATVMTPNGTWSGAVGKADGVRDMRPDDQLAIGSITKSVIAAQVMQLVEAGELALDDPVSNHLPAGLDFDTNHATIRELLGMHSGIPDYVDELWHSLTTNRKRRWTPRDVLHLVAASRSPAGGEFEYSSTNYVLLGLIIEEIRGRPMVDVLRDGVLDVDGTERLIYQPDERPTAPMAMPDGESMTALKQGGGYLPSLAGATAAGPAGGMASDSPSLARWWQAFCAGEIVSQASLTEMATFHDGYGLGLYHVADLYEQAVGHGGEHVGYVSWAACVPEHASVVVVLSNRMVDISAVALPLLSAASSN